MKNNQRICIWSMFRPDRWVRKRIRNRKCEWRATTGRWEAEALAAEAGTDTSAAAPRLAAPTWASLPQTSGTDLLPATVTDRPLHRATDRPSSVDLPLAVRLSTDPPLAVLPLVFHPAADLRWAVLPAAVFHLSVVRPAAAPAPVAPAPVAPAPAPAARAPAPEPPLHPPPEPLPDPLPPAPVSRHWEALPATFYSVAFHPAAFHPLAASLLITLPPAALLQLPLSAADPPPADPPIVDPPTAVPRWPVLPVLEAVPAVPVAAAAAAAAAALPPRMHLCLPLRIATARPEWRWWAVRFRAEPTSTTRFFPAFQTPVSAAAVNSPADTTPTLKPAVR